MDCSISPERPTTMAHLDAAPTTGGGAASDDTGDELLQMADPVLEAVARAICFAWGHCAGGCQFRGAQCEGDAACLLADWQGRSARAALDAVRTSLPGSFRSASDLDERPGCLGLQPA